MRGYKHLGVTREDRTPGSDPLSSRLSLGNARPLDPSVELVQDNPCLIEFIASVLALPKPSPSILSFTLRLAGILAASEGRFQHLQVS